jgi:hypothetical protein
LGVLQQGLPFRAEFSDVATRKGGSIMRKFTAGIAGIMTVACLLLDAGPALAITDPPRGWTFNFAQARPIGENRTVSAERGLVNVPVRTPSGSKVGNFQRIEIQDGETPMGIVTMNETYRTVAIPLDRLRFNPRGREVLTDMSWLEVNMIPSGIRPKGSRWHPYGRPVG